MRAWLIGLGVLVGSLSACGDENRTPTHFTPSNDKTSTSSNDTTARPAPAVPGAIEPPRQPTPPPASAAVSLVPLDTSSLRGSGRLAGFGRMTSVAVRLTQGKQGFTYDGAVRQGACTRLGATVASLNPVSADSLGLGAAATDVSVPIDSLLSGRHVVVYGHGGRPQTCADLGRPAPGDPAPLPPGTTPPPPVRPDTARRDSATARSG